MEIHQSTSPSMIPTVNSRPLIFPKLTSAFLVRERETLLLHLIPDLVHSVCVDLVNKKLDHKKKEKHRRWGSEAFFIQRYAKWKIMGTILLSLTTSLPLSPDHSSSISSSTNNGKSPVGSGKSLEPKGLLLLWSQVRAMWLLIWWSLEAYMVVNFRVRGISRGARKLVRTPTLN
jgi:hypothetical protein